MKTKIAKRIVGISVFGIVFLSLGVFCSSYLQWNAEVAQQAMEEDFLWVFEPNSKILAATRCISGIQGLWTEEPANMTASIQTLGGDTLFAFSTYNENAMTNLGYGIFEVSEDGVETSHRYMGVCVIPEEQFCYGDAVKERPGAAVFPYREGVEMPYRLYNRQNLYWSDEEYRNATYEADGFLVVQKENLETWILSMDGSQRRCTVQDVYFEENQISERILRMYQLQELGSGESVQRYLFLNVAENRTVCQQDKTFEAARDFHEGLAAVRTGGLWGYISADGEVVIPQIYTAAFDFSDGCACVTDRAGETYFIDATGKQVTPSIEAASWIGEYHDGVYVRSAGNMAFRLDSVESRKNLPDETFINCAFQDGVWILTDLNGCGVYFPESDVYVEGYTEGNDDQTVTIDNDDCTVLYRKPDGEPLCKYESISAFSEGLARVSDGRNNGVIDNQGNLVLPLLSEQEFGYFLLFSNGTMSVSVGDDQVGMIANPLIYESWVPDEQTRAASLGLTVSQSAVELTYPQMWDGIAEVAALYLQMETSFGTEDPQHFSVSVDEIRQKLEEKGYPSEGVVDRQHLAVALTELMRAYGRVVDGYLPLYSDSGDIQEDCRSAMAYTGTLGIFSLDKEGNVAPFEPVTTQDLPVYLLRFFENSISNREENRENVMPINIYSPTTNIDYMEKFSVV